MAWPAEPSGCAAAATSFTARLKIDGDFPQGVSIRAYPDEEPVIVGSDRISGWRETVLCGVDVWEADVAYSELNALYSDSGGASKRALSQGGHALRCRGQRAGRRL